MGRGGNRAGAGRPKRDTVAVSLRLPVADIDLIRSTAEELGIPLGDVVHEMIESYVEHAEKGD